ncbi:hypothetical protein J007_01993 [Cryptococcus neoformans]|nr:hypothetical protein J007_01993 [Cryptococcus neoformans var. grubii]
MPIMSHSAATMGEFGNLILGKDEDKGCERLRKRIRQAKEEEEEGDDNNKVQWDTGLCDESDYRHCTCNALTSLFMATHKPLSLPHFPPAQIALGSLQTWHLLQLLSLFLFPFLSLSLNLMPHLPVLPLKPCNLATPGNQGIAESSLLPRAKQGILSGNERGKACSTEDQLQLLTEASKANSERRHRDILCIKEVKHVIVEDNSMSVDISAQSN